MGGGWWRENNFVVDPPNQSCIFSYLINITKSTLNPYCGQESTFYIPSILIPLSTPTLEGWQWCHTLKRNNSAFKTVHCRCLTPYSLVSQPWAQVGVKYAYFRDDILLPSSWGKKKIKEKIDKLCSLVFVKNKLFLILFSAKLHSFQQPSHISDKQCIGQAFNSSFWGTQDKIALLIPYNWAQIDFCLLGVKNLYKNITCLSHEQ